MYWLQFSDYYEWPHIQYFDDFNELKKKLLNSDFQSIHKILTNNQGHEKQAGMKVILDYLKQPDVSNTSPPTEIIMKQRTLLRK